MDLFHEIAGEQLIDSLPPVPLALLFLTVLLEQKVVLSSSRRSMLTSAATATLKMLHPLEWSHLYVPIVPLDLAPDLVQYPAPFLIGIPSEDDGSLELLNSLPDDITLVDLDVGRVILAKSFGLEDTDVGALRSQVLYLAESIGMVFGSNLQGHSWWCDSPMYTLSEEKPRQRLSFKLPHTMELQLLPQEQLDEEQTRQSRIDILQQVCSVFITELLSGVFSCCFWIEEKATEDMETETTVLLDEDRYFHIKNLRAQGRYLPLLMEERFFEEEGTTPAAFAIGRLLYRAHLALGLDDFDLVLETFMRCQSLNAFISSSDRNQMAFW